MSIRRLTPLALGPDSVLEAVVARSMAELDAGMLELLSQDLRRPWASVVWEATGHGPVAVEARRLAAVRARRVAQEAADFRRHLTCSPDSAEHWALALGLVEPSDLVAPTSPADALAALAETDRAVRAAAGRRLAAVVGIAGVARAVTSRSDRHVAHEIAIALGISKDSAEHVIAQARALFGEYAPFGHALVAGEVSEWHCRTLIEATVHVTDLDTRQVLGELALPSARSMVVAEFRTQLESLISELDPDAVARHQRAKDTRNVYVRRGKDGLSFLGLTHETPIIDAIHAALLEDGRLLAEKRANDITEAESARVHADGHPEGDLGADACRADALVARILGTVAGDGSVTFDRAGATVITTEIVIDLDTLRGLENHVALINGQPVPAQVARDLAAWSTLIRRVVTDPVTGHLLDYGARIYLPDDLRRHCFARDRGCRSPNCTRRAHRLLQLDHAEEFPVGPSSAANSGALCVECHQRKTDGLLDITESSADGSATFTTAYGQTVHIPARPYLPRTRPTPPDTRPAHDPDDPPPF